MSERTVQRVDARVVVRSIDNAGCTMRALTVTSKLRLQGLALAAALARPDVQSALTDVSWRTGAGHVTGVSVVYGEPESQLIPVRDTATGAVAEAEVVWPNETVLADDGEPSTASRGRAPVLVRGGTRRRSARHRSAWCRLSPPGPTNSSMAWRMRSVLPRRQAGAAWAPRMLTAWSRSTHPHDVAVHRPRARNVAARQHATLRVRHENASCQTPAQGARMALRAGTQDHRYCHRARDGRLRTNLEPRDQPRTTLVQ